MLDLIWWRVAFDIVVSSQHIVTLSTTEVEIIAVASCACQGVWLRRVLEEVKYIQQSPIMLFCDNSLTIKLSKKCSLAWKKQTH